MAALTTIALVAGATAAVAGTAIAYDSAKDQKKEMKKSRAAAEAKQKEQEALALEEKKKSDLKVKEANARLLKGATGKGGLLYGSELGVAGDDSNLGTTLGA